MHTFCIVELPFGRVSIKLFAHYNFLENILVEGKARNRHCPVNERKPRYTSEKAVQTQIRLHLIGEA